MKVLLLILSVIQLSLIEINAIYCYRCTSTQPGCATPFNWHWRFWGEGCPADDDICVKIIERKDATEVITRECLSTIKSFRTDIPADLYEGCRPAAKDVRLAHYVNNTIKELDIRRDHYDSTTFCFCFLDHRCNGGVSNQVSVLSILTTLSLGLFYLL